MESIDVKITKNMQEAVDSLGGNLCQSEPFVLYKQAVQALESDSKASDLLHRLAQAQTYMRSQQSQSSTAPADVENLRSLQREAQTNEIILNYIRRQQAAIAYIREINQEISQLLAVDFGAMARRSCC